MKSFVLFTIFHVLCLVSFANTLQEKEVLEHLSTYYDSLNSVIISTKTATINNSTKSGTFSKKYSFNDNEPAVTVSEFRTDGIRTQDRMYIYGPVLGRRIDEKDAKYQSNLWDGENMYTYGANYDLPNNRYPKGSGVLQKKPLSPSLISNTEKFKSGACSILGYQFQDTDRLDIVLKQSKKVSLLNAREEVNGRSCCVLATVGENGKHKIWLDPERGYCVMKIKNVKTDGNIAFLHRYRLRGEDKIVYSMEVEEMTEVDGVWIPKKLTGKLERTADNGEFLFATETQQEVTNVIVDPDHEALGSFIPDDIPNGAVFTTNKLASVKYNWVDGKLVPISDVASQCEP